MHRVKIVILAAGHLAREVWRAARRLYAGARERRTGRAEPASIRRQYVFGAISRDVFERALRQRRRLKRRKAA